MKKLTGYNLIDDSNNIIDVFNQDTIPHLVVIPKEDVTICSPCIGEVYPGYKLVEVWNDIPEQNPILNSVIPPNVFVVSKKQFLQQSVLSGYISIDEALAAARTGVIPESILNSIDIIPSEEVRFSHKMEFICNTEFNKNCPFIKLFKTTFNLTDEELDLFFVDAIKL